MGPLKGFTIIELAGIGPAPFAGMVLADMGATVIRVDRREKSDLGIPGRAPKFDVLARGRRSIAVDLKSDAGIAVVKRLAAKADALIEGFRPGVLERLGLGPDILADLNPKIVVGRMTGFGQHGPMANRAGHDINYISLTGALHAIGRAGQPPVPPLNLVGDFGGGGMLLAFGVVAALLETSRSGKGQVVDAAMVDGAAYLMAMIFGMRSAGHWQDIRGVNILDTGAPWYDVYETADNKHIAVGAIEGRFYEEFLNGLGLAAADLPKQHDRKRWPELRARFTTVIKSKTRDDWAKIFGDKDACVTPVLSLDEVAHDPHMAARQVLQTRDGVTAPAPAPRFSRTQQTASAPAHEPGADTAEILSEFGFTSAEVQDLSTRGITGGPA
jgi:alpha-methylacyl-CoA racemase